MKQKSDRIEKAAQLAKANAFQLLQLNAVQHPEKETDIGKFYSNVERTDYCWLWKGGYFKRKNGNKSYGAFFAGWFPSRLAHRFSYLIHYGELPNNLKVLHRCDNTKCVNPEHLFLGTQRDNVADMISKGRDNHPKGIEVKLAKLTEEDVKQIRSLYIFRITTYQMLADRFAVSYSTIVRVLKNLTWKHV